MRRARQPRGDLGGSRSDRAACSSFQHRCCRCNGVAMCLRCSCVLRLLISRSSRRSRTHPMNRRTAMCAATCAARPLLMAGTMRSNVRGSAKNSSTVYVREFQRVTTMLSQIALHHSRAGCALIHSTKQQLVNCTRR